VLICRTLGGLTGVSLAVQESVLGLADDDESEGEVCGLVLVWQTVHRHLAANHSHRLAMPLKFAPRLASQQGTTLPNCTLSGMVLLWYKY